MLFGQTAAPTGWTKDTTHDNKALRLVTGTASTGGVNSFTAVFTTRTILQANLPNVTLTTTITDPGHAHNINSTSTGTIGANPYLTQATTVGGSVSGLMSNATTGITASTALGGSGTAMEFDVQYVDVILATKA
jgi:hypothetical protein